MQIKIVWISTRGKSSLRDVDSMAWREPKGLLKRYIKFIPITIAIILILALTLMNTPKNVEMSEAFRQWLNRVYTRLGMDTENVWWNTSSGIRKLGHVLEYGLLGFSSAIAFEHKRWAIVLCLVVSVIDQSVKILVPIRHFDITDVPFDIAGALMGIGIVVAVGMLVRSFHSSGA